MRQFEKLVISHPLAHCEAAMALSNELARLANEYPIGNKLRVAANEEFLRHIGRIEDEEKNCEICIKEMEGKDERYQRKQLMDHRQRSIRAGWVPS